MRRLWERVQGDPAFMRAFHGWMCIFWLANFPFVIVLYFISKPVWAVFSILYLALVSIYANAVGHMSAWQSSRIEAEEADRDRAQEVVDAIKQDPDC